MSIGDAIREGFEDATGMRMIKVRLTEYYPKNTKMEGGLYDHKGHPLNTLDDYLDGKVGWVSLARDYLGGPPANAWEFKTYGYRVHIPEVCAKLKVSHIDFRLVDTGGRFYGKGKQIVEPGYEPIDVCRSVKLRYPSIASTLTYLIPVGVSMTLP
jgi:hypothetical protein